ncbi:PucR family transcriptional regulator [Streptantibioticus silvisoli]|uniref:Helix-turn-helix domain-containing protein n=1 Tax=Streptantibioticus silvisoli TaxID=2705255 RepID=A0ABT6VWK0_9ACTN|nr:helix-turn-helix domain-containing protein [Streptantibioticus silvisoli]MDI5962515.1 helix-turn-helix domain-containing protein [Streptantibioticus silvisoli]
MAAEDAAHTANAAETAETADTAASANAAGATLRTVLALGAGEALDVVSAPRGLDVPLRDVVMLDERDLPRARDCVVLAVGVDPLTPRAVEAMRAAADAGAAAVVYRPAPDGRVRPAVRAAADAAGVAVLTRASGVDWADAAGVLRTAVAYATTDPAEGPGARLGDLAALADVIAELTGGSVTVEDNASRVLAHSSTGMEADPLRRQTILGGRVPGWRVDELRRSGLFRAVLASHEVVHREADAGNPERMVIAVRAGTEILGSLWLAPDGGPLPPRARRALTDAARMAVPHLMYHRVRDQAAAGRRDEAIRSLLHGRGDLPAHAVSLGLATDQPCAVLVAEPLRPGGDMARTLNALVVRAGAARDRVQVLREVDRMLVLLPEPPGGGQAAELGRQLAALADSLTPRRPVLVGVGPVVAGALEADTSRAGAERVLRVLRTRHGDDRSRSARLEEVAVPATLLRMLDAARPAWQEGVGPLHLLAEHEREHGGELLESLAVYLDEFGDVAAAAARLTVHTNTLRYRLRRMRERFGVDLDDPDTRLLAMLAVRLLREDG